MQLIETSSGPGILTDQGSVVMANDTMGIAKIATTNPEICNQLADRLRRDVTAMDDIAQTLRFPSTGRVPQSTYDALNAGVRCADSLRAIAQAIDYDAPPSN